MNPVVIQISIISLETFVPMLTLGPNDTCQTNLHLNGLCDHRICILSLHKINKQILICSRFQKEYNFFNIIRHQINFRTGSLEKIEKIIF